MIIKDIGRIYHSAWAFALACPLLFMIPVLVEFAQHVVEIQAGMYVNEAGAKAAEADPLRLQFGYAKTLALLLPGYWFTRFVLFGHDDRRAAQIEWPAFGLWLVVFVLGAGRIGWSLFGPSLTELFGLEEHTAFALSVTAGLIFQIVMIYLAALLVAWPLGNFHIGPFRSATIMHGSFWYALALVIAGIVPLIVLHYAFGIAAIVWLPLPFDWAVMVLDSITVGFLALTIMGGTIFAAKHAAERKNIALLPHIVNP